MLLQREPVDPKFQVKVVAPTNHSSSQKTRLNDLSYDEKIWTDISSILSHITRLTDRRTEFSSLDRVCIACSAIKTPVYDFNSIEIMYSLKPNKTTANTKLGRKCRWYVTCCFHQSKKKNLQLQHCPHSAPLPLQTTMF